MGAVESSLSQEYFGKLYNRISRNSDIADMYDRLAEKEPDHEYKAMVYYDEIFGKDEYETRKKKLGKYDSFVRKSQSVRSCLKWWDIDYFRLQQVKDIKRVNLCHDKFCLNCQSAIADKRQFKYEPILNSFLDRYIVCHCVFTVVNPKGSVLKLVIRRMYRQFGSFIRYLRGNARVRGISFLKYGFGGGLRSLEVTYNTEKRTYHPHFHCMLLFRKDCAEEVFKNPVNLNSFSYDRDNPDYIHYYTDMEILFQKVWYLLYKGEKVTYQAIQNLKEGFSVQVNDAEGHYNEVFKYSCKGAFNEESGSWLYDDEIFETLQGALDKRRMIQGYGELRGFKDDDAELLDNLAEDKYNACIAQLLKFETPERVYESLEEVVNEENCQYISKLNFKRLLSEELKGE